MVDEVRFWCGEVTDLACRARKVQTCRMTEANWYMYVVRCSDETLYTGITTDVERRVSEHNVSARGARYTRARRPVRLEAAWAHASRSEAAKAEYAFKQLSRGEKLERIDERSAHFSGTEA